MNKTIHGATVHGIGIDEATRCAHYRSPLDIIAVKFKCCGKWFPCYECHRAVETHQSQIWTKKDYIKKAILCGVCGHRLSIGEYVASDSRCPQCRSRFNPKCANHYHLYFEF